MNPNLSSPARTFPRVGSRRITRGEIMAGTPPGDGKTDPARRANAFLDGNSELNQEPRATRGGISPCKAAITPTRPPPIPDALAPTANSSRYAALLKADSRKNHQS